MSYTNKTANYELPQWIGTDKPTFLEDMNEAYQAIDTAMKENAQAAAAAQSTADTNTGSISTLDTQVNGTGGIASQISDIAGDITTLTGNVNTINSLIGDGTPTTTAQTLIGAINELEAGKASDTDVKALETKVGTAALTTTAPDLCGAVNELNAKKPYIEFETLATATADGVKTNAALLTELNSPINIVTANDRNSLIIEDSDGIIYHAAGDKFYTRVSGSATAITAGVLKVGGTSHSYVYEITAGGFTATETSATVATKNFILKRMKSK